jgi:YD repeat-containing protein
MLATVVLGLALVSLPTGRAAAAATCTWQKTTWDLPVGTNVGTVDGYDGNRYAVGITGRRSLSGIADPHGTLWDHGKVVLRIAGEIPHLRDVNAAGLIVGDNIVNNRFVAVTIDHSGQSTLLPANPAWESSSAWLVNNAGDIVGSAGIGLQHTVVVWPANAPGIYRELPSPGVSLLHLTAVDEQGRITAQTDSGSGGGFVWDTDGQWRVLAAQGANGFGTPWAVRDGRVVGSMNDDTSFAAAEWNAQGRLVRTIRDGAISAVAIGGNGTVGGYALVDSQKRVVLWRDGTVIDPLSAVTAGFGLRGISDDERTLVGTEANRPAQYLCS